VTNGDILDVKGYHTIINICTSLRGTAILHKLNIKLHRVERLPSGRVISVYLDDTCIANIYAPPSGTARRTEREDFFNEGIIGLLRISPTKLILAGDFKCVLNTSDSTGQRTCSRALARLVIGLRLKDAWDSGMDQRA